MGPSSSNSQRLPGASKTSAAENMEVKPHNGIRTDLDTDSREGTVADVDAHHAAQAATAKATPPPQHEALPSTKRQRSISTLKWLLKDQWFILAMSILILISSQVQVPSAQQRIKRTVITYLSVSVIFFCNGCTLDTKLLLENYMRWKLHVFVQLQCYLVTSAATFAIVSLCATNPNFSTYCTCH
jgi:sodium/bile acid cotransporter 7